MIFVAPWVLLGLLALPVLWWLLRVTPPAPRSEVFPAIRFLLGLNATEETPARTPWWLLALRMAAAGLVIVALARPVLDAGAALAGKGPVLLVMDNGWASADDWVAPQGGRGRAAGPGGTGGAQGGAAGDRAGRRRQADRGFRHDADGRSAGAAGGACSRKPWPSDRPAAAAAIRAWKDRDGASVIYVPDGLTDGADFDRFAAAMREAGPVTEICCDACRSPLLLPPTSEADRLDRASGAGAAGGGDAGQRAGAERRRAHPGADGHHRAGRGVGRLRLHRPAAGIAQPADPAGAGRAAERRVGRAAG